MPRIHRRAPRGAARLILIVLVLAPTAACSRRQERHTEAPGVPHLLDARDVYAADRPGLLSDTVKRFPSRVYVPNTESDTVDVVDPATYRVVERMKVGHQPQHVTPSWDLKTLWVLNDKGNSLTRIDPATAKKGETVAVDDPYNMYYTPDGRFA